MSRNRFQIIASCLHFAESVPGATKPSAGETTDRLWRIRLVLDHFQNKMRSMYYPDCFLSIDEQMLLWRGRLKFRTFIKTKAHKYGIKVRLRVTIYNSNLKLKL